MIMCGWQMDLYALHRGRRTLSVMNFDFDGPSLKGRSELVYFKMLPKVVAKHTAL